MRIKFFHLITRLLLLAFLTGVFPIQSLLLHAQTEEQDKKKKKTRIGEVECVCKRCCQRAGRARRARWELDGSKQEASREPAGGEQGASRELGASRGLAGSQRELAGSQQGASREPAGSWELAGSWQGASRELAGSQQGASRGPAGSWELAASWQGARGS